MIDLLADESSIALLKTISAATLLAAVQLFFVVIFDASYYNIYIEAAGNKTSSAKCRPLDLLRFRG